MRLTDMMMPVCYGILIVINLFINTILFHKFPMFCSAQNVIV